LSLSHVDQMLSARGAPVTVQQAWLAHRTIRNLALVQFSLVTALEPGRWAQPQGIGGVSANVNELRLGFSNTTRNPEGILSHINRKS
jgi:hypothetical protein